MFENVLKFFKKIIRTEKNETNSKDTAKERLHLVLMQDRANVSADFLELMKQEIIDVIKKYIEVEESAIDVRLTNDVKEDGTTGAPSLYANIPIVNIKNEAKKEVTEQKKAVTDVADKKEEKIEKDDSKKEEEKISEEENKNVEEENSKKENKNDEPQIKEETTEVAGQKEQQEEKKETSKAE